MTFAGGGVIIISKVLVLDLGGNLTQYLAREIRKKGVYSEVIPAATSFEKIEKEQPGALVISGGPEKVSEQVCNLLDREIFNLSIPVLALGYGVIPLIEFYGGLINLEEIEPDISKAPMQTSLEVYPFKEDPLNKVISSSVNSLWKAPLQISIFPEKLKGNSQTAEGQIASLQNADGKQLGYLYYPSLKAMECLLEYFLFDLAKLNKNWSPTQMIENTINSIQKKVGEHEKAVCGLSGGVDSAVAALLTQQAIGNRLVGIFVDHGLLRRGEKEQVIETFKNDFQINLIQVDAAEEFLELLSDIEDPEEKRKIIGNHFIKVFEREAHKLENVKYLVQGTIYPDVVESMNPAGHTVKTHHNVGGIPEKMNLTLIEPVRGLFKDEVRKVGEALGLPEELVGRHPFPGPGLAVRVLGKVTREKLEIVRSANAIVEEEVKKEGLYRDIWQVFAVLPDIKTVGVSGDRRTYAYPVVVRAVTSTDAMKAEWYRFSYDFLDRLAKRIVEEIPQVNRVAYDITSKPPATIEWE